MPPVSEEEEKETVSPPLVALNARSDFARRPVLPSTINSFNNSIIIYNLMCVIILCMQ